jgi:hypothetical protein
MRQRGVALLMMIVFLPALAAGLAWLASGTQLMTRFEGHNQADRVAYSMGAQLARELNEVAVLNRKILASHLMVGHLTTYLSFTRYLKQVVDGVSSIVPYANRIVAGGTTLLVASAEFQLKTGVGLALASQHQWAFDSAEILLKAGTRSMQVAESMAPPWSVQSVCIATLCGRAALDALMLAANPVIEANPANYSRLTMQAMSGLPQANWHLSRNWQQNVLGILQARRVGSTRSDLTGRGFVANEALQARVRLFFFGLGWRTIASGSASTIADGFVYRGLPWLIEWQGPELAPLSVTLKHPEGGTLKAESRVRFMGAGDADMWRPVWRSELTGGV